MSRDCIMALGPKASVVFKVPDMNMGDVRTVLTHPESFVVHGVTGLMLATASLEFIGEVEATTDVSNFAYTIFCLRGLAKVGLSTNAMNTLFWRVNQNLPMDISRDPFTWAFLDTSKFSKRLITDINTITQDEKIMEAFLKQEPFAAVTVEPVIVRYKQR